uniref:Wsv433-like protein n=1 Tax=Penaeus semisulcatus majanivirus TaxID=2984274 RepID=A0A9C7BHM1_9VIRU|nr:MAG: wsv433-like protein [Penaeus semisulcatus majanivirus]
MAELADGANINELIEYIAVKKSNNTPPRQNATSRQLSKKIILKSKKKNHTNKSNNNNNINKNDNISKGDDDDNNSNIINNDNNNNIDTRTTTTTTTTSDTDISDNSNTENDITDVNGHISHTKPQEDDPDTLMKKGLSLLLEGAQKKRSNVQEFHNYQSTHSEKHDAFSPLSDLKKSQSITENTISKMTKRQELDTIIQSIDLTRRCAIIYDEAECRKFVERHRRVILCTAYCMFKKKMPTKLRGYNVKIKNLENANSRASGVNLSRWKNRHRSEIVLEDQRERNGSVYGFKVDGVKYADLMTNFAKENHTDPITNPSQNKRVQKEIMQDEALPPEKRRRLDLSIARNSLVFSQLRRMDSRRPLYRKNKTFWQFEHHRHHPVEVVGWFEPKPIPGFEITINEATDRFYMPHSFQNMARLLMNFFRGYLVQHTSIDRRRKKTNMLSCDDADGVGDADGENTRVLVPQKDMSTEYEDLTKSLDDCLMILLSIHTDALSDSSAEIYRQKFRRYCIYSFCMYLLNSPLHSHSVSPLPYNYFNFYSYLFAHGPGLKTTSFLNTMCFLNNNLFKLYRGSATESVQRLVDFDYAFLKGGKSVTHTFGSPSKTSIHTRTLVSFMMYSEYMMRVLHRLLEKIEQSNHSERYQSVENKARQNLSRLCEGVLFVFFSFVFFHRISAVRQLTNWSALRLILGQPHIHDSKSKAKALMRAENAMAEQAKPSSEDDDGFVYTTKRTNSSCLFFSHAHILGLPYGIQKRLGVPLEKINPLLLSSSSSSPPPISSSSFSLGVVSDIGDESSYIVSNSNINNDNDNNNNSDNDNDNIEDEGTGSDDTDNKDNSDINIKKKKKKKKKRNENNKIIMCGIDLPLPPPPPDGYCGKLVMFDNIFSEQMNEYYNDESLMSDLALTVASKMSSNPWTSMSLVDTNKKKKTTNKTIYTKPPSRSDPEQYKLLKDTLDYFAVSPLKDVFITSSSSSSSEHSSKRILSLGDLALLALWIKISVLREAWENEGVSSLLPLSLPNDRAVTVSENWLSGLCRQLIRTDLVNFGVWGDVKIDLKLDTRNNALHRNNVSLPKARDKLKYAHAALSQRKFLAELHCKKNIKTKTHLGRVTATSWVVCALKSISRGDPDVFLKLLEDVGIYHLSHTNPANTYVYFSDNCLSNEDQMGLNGYISRMITSDNQLVLHEGARRELGRGAFRSTNKQNIVKRRRKATAAMMKMAIKYWAKNIISDNSTSNGTIDDIDTDKDGRKCTINSTEILWSWPYTSRRCLVGKKIPLVCKRTRFLNYCMSDSLVSYDYNDPTSSYHLTFKVIDDKKNSDSSEEDNDDINDDEEEKREEEEEEKEDNADDASTVTVDTSSSRNSSITNDDSESISSSSSSNLKRRKISRKNILNVPIELLRDKLSSSAVITTSKNIYKFNKFELAKSQKDKENIRKHITFSKIASNIEKASQRSTNDTPNPSSSTKEKELLSTIEPDLLEMGIENESCLLFGE